MNLLAPTAKVCGAFTGVVKRLKVACKLHSNVLRIKVLSGSGSWVRVGVRVDSWIEESRLVGYSLQPSDSCIA